MKSTFVFCVPGEAYGGRRERAAASAYKRMAIRGYDALVDFSRGYNKWKEHTDFKRYVGRKGNMELVVQGFVEQQVTRVGAVEGRLNSSSFLFNPINPQFPERMLPDLDVIQLDGERAQEAAQQIAEFYDIFRWKPTIFSGELPIITVNTSKGSRFLSMGEHSLRRLAVVDPSALGHLAQDIAGYNPQRIYWGQR